MTASTRIAPSRDTIAALHSRPAFERCRSACRCGKPAMKSPSIKGKTVEDIQKVIASSPKHAGLKSLTADDVKDIAAYLGTLK